MPNPVRQKAIDGLYKGDTFVHTRRFSQKETEEFGDLTRDYNPVHYDPRWTTAKGFGGLICHGLIVGSMICEIGGQIGWLATGMDFKFIRPVYMGDTITCRMQITTVGARGRAEADAVFTNQDGETVCRARLTGRVPMKKEKNILKQMVAEGDPTNKLSASRSYSIHTEEQDEHEP
jgi:acyl dehydratase